MVVLFRLPSNPGFPQSTVELTNVQAGAVSPAPPVPRHASAPLRLTPAEAILRAEVENPVAVLSAFAGWAERFLAGDPSAGAIQGEALAWKRREAMLRLIESDPEKAIAMTVPFRWRKALPAGVTRYFEQWVDGHGDLTVAVGTDFERRKSTMYREAQIGGNSYRAFVYGDRSRQGSRKGIPLHGLALGGKMAVLADAVRILDPEEAAALEEASGGPVDAICGVSRQPADYRQQEVAADIGGEVRHFCGVDHVKLVNQAKLATAADDQWARGVKSVLYMRVNFPDDLTEPISEAAAHNVMDGVNAFFTAGSYNLAALDTIVTPLLTLPEKKAWYASMGPGALLTSARAAARQAGFDTARFDRDIVTFTPIQGFDFGGLAAVRAKGVWLQSPGVGVTAHELGHNYGLFHANYWDTTNTSTFGVGTNLEYGNLFDTMGSGLGGQFNASHKNILNWLPDTAVHRVVSNGVYRIHPFDISLRTDGRFYAAKVKRDFRRDYWLEFHTAFPGNDWMRNGVMVHWAPWAESEGGTHLLDTTPGTPTPIGETREDAAVVIGRTFSDPAAGVHITPLRRGATGTNVWIDVQINTGALAGNRAPVMKLETERTTVAPGGLVHFHVTASDPDGDALAYAWTFDDLSFSTNNLPWTFKSWTAPGDHVVRCVVSDMKGGVASANAVVTVGAPAGNRISGRVLDANGVPVEGVRVDNGSLIAGEYLGGYTDSDGVYIITGVTEEFDLRAFKYGFAFTNLTWMNPVPATSSVVSIDFVALPLPIVSIAASTNHVPESDATVHTFTISRTGDTGTNLFVNLFVSGSASAADYTLDPLTNVIEFLPGQESVQIQFQTIDDSTIEGPQTATVTIGDGELYVPGELGEATITIGDDDAAAAPAVSITSIIPTVPENGMDSGMFEFSRTGGTQASLQVFYSVGGGATAGVDYSPLLGVVIIPAGSSNVFVPFQARDDKILETNEVVAVTITPDAAYTIGTGSAQAVISDDDQLLVTVFPTGSGAGEPLTGGIFTIKRDGDLTGDLVVHYTLTGTAINNVDYTTTIGPATIPAGASSVDVPIIGLDDAFVEGDESVILTLLTNAAYNIGTPGSATQFIRDNEKVTVSVTAIDGTAVEAGDDIGMFRISRGSVTSGNLVVDVAVNGVSLPGSDYVPIDLPVIIPDGANAVTLPIIAFHDLHYEPMEDVRLTLLPSTNYNLGSPREALVTIEDDGFTAIPGIGFSFSTSSVPENLSPGISVLLSVTNAFAQFTVDYVVIGGTASSADYVLGSGTLTLDPGEWAKAIPVSINNDTLVEPDETIRIALFNPIGATLDGIKIHTYTILDDDTASVTVSATAASASEAGPVAGNFRISRVGATNSSLTVSLEISGSASAPGDYAPLGVSATIPAGATFVDLPVVPVNDQTVEHGETVVVRLVSAPGAKFPGPNTATVNISDDDPEGLPVITASSSNSPYAVEGGGSGEFLLTRTGPTNSTLTVFFSLIGTASNGGDYVFLTNMATIPAGQLSVAIPVVPINDSAIEGEETVQLALSVRDTYRAAWPAFAVVTLQDNDQVVRVDPSDFDASEAGTNYGEFTFTRFGTTNGPLQVFYTIAGTAGNGLDYVAISNSLVIPAGSLSAALPIVPLDDVLIEGPEAVTLTLSANALYSLSSAISATVTIMDDEPMLTITNLFPTPGIREGHRPPAVLRITRTGDPKYDFTAGLAVSGTATFGVDYPAFPTNVYFACGVMAIDLLVAPTNELAVEPNESLTVALRPDPTYTVLSPTNATLVILDAGANRTPLVTITSPATNRVFLPGTNVGIVLEAIVTDDLDTNTPLVLNWTNVSGPNTLVFGETTNQNTTVIFTNTGVYVLRLTADDGVLQGFDEVTAVVGAVERFSSSSLHWPFDEGSGTSVGDVSGAGRDGVFVGTPAWVSNGVMGGALNFSGANHGVRLNNDPDFLNGLDQFSLSLWVNSTAASADRGIFCADGSGTNTTLSLYTRSLASCSAGSNVIELIVPTTAGVVKRVSASHVATNGWQHLAVTWSNGLAPALFINGQLDQPLSTMLAVSGVLTNCPEFIVGRSPKDSPNSWQGRMDDVRVFPRALSADEVAALAALPPTNYGAVVHAGEDITVQFSNPYTLAGTVADDGRPIPPGAVSNTWSAVSGPVPVSIPDPGNLTNVVQFTTPGEYVFRLIGDDGEVKVFDDVMVTVIEPTQVYIFASDGDAGELGPNPGQFIFQRFGDLNFTLQVQFAFAGFASNGMDFVAFTNVVTFPAGIDAVPLDVVPFLDHPIEGDEPLTLVLVSNLAYTIIFPEATVIIRDSPYGQWSVQRFTLEELTDPTISGEAADLDGDGFKNFVEYAFNRDPRTPETNSPLVLTFELYPDDNQVHATLTYTRRLMPTDTGYIGAVSGDLFSWLVGTSDIEEISATDDGNGLTETVKARLAEPFSTSTANKFATIRVWLQTTGP